MAIVNTDRLNEFWINGILPIKRNVDNLLESGVGDLEYVTATSEDIDELIALIVDGSSIPTPIPDGGGGSGSGSSSGGTVIVSGAGGIVQAYIRSNGTTYEESWLSDKSPDSDALTPKTDILYVIITSGDYYNQIYRWNKTTSKYEIIRGIGGASGGGGGGSSDDDEEIDIESAINETLNELENENNPGSNSSNSGD